MPPYQGHNSNFLIFPFKTPTLSLAKTSQFPFSSSPLSLHFHPPKTMRFINPNRTLLPFSFLLSFIILSVASPASSSIHDLLRSQGLPPGLLPKEVRSYTLSADGRLEIFLDGPCLTKFENLVYYDSVVKANLTYASLTGVVGLSQEELFLWLPVKDIIVSDPDSGLILFDIGVAHKQLSLSLFEDPPRCRPPQQGILENHATEEKNGFEAMRR